MSEFKKGDTVRARRSGIDYNEGDQFVVDGVDSIGWLKLQGHGRNFYASNFEKVGPEDKADLYVEPEPLKEGDWVQVWAQVEEQPAEVDEPGDMWLSIPYDSHGHMASTYVASFNIIRTDDTPPWVKEESVSLLDAFDRLQIPLTVTGQMAHKKFRASLVAATGGAS